MKRTQRLMLERAQNVAHRVLPHLDRHLRDPGQRPAVRPRERREIADDEHVRAPGIVRSGSTLTRPARSSGTPSAHQRRRGDPRCPEDGFRRIVSLPIATLPAATPVTIELVRT